MKIDLKAFLQAAFGWHDSESGWGAQYPASRDIQSFFAGRIGKTFTAAAIQDADNLIDPIWQESAQQLAQDLKDLADQIEELLPQQNDDFDNVPF